MTITEALKSKIIGAKITDIRSMTGEDITAIYGADYWDPSEDSPIPRVRKIMSDRPVIVVLDSGVEISIQQAEENNGPGVFAFFDPKTGTEAYDWELNRKE